MEFIYSEMKKNAEYNFTKALEGNIFIPHWKAIGLIQSPSERVQKYSLSAAVKWYVVRLNRRQKRRDGVRNWLSVLRAHDDCLHLRGLMRTLLSSGGCSLSLTKYKDKKPIDF